ncbi:unnamed protein product [Rhizoctonia solani]|uniref:Transmembrane protein n=3 Tax=Rhizoctonia solani TaxID=456999 RepID=A0A8H3AYE9_9AGAM|nr:transmembrane protein, putative [Rhizoctonia solani AG-3 Rhs1AP]KEP53226.1 putative transmembrane protein [Rhizoctonia solani 123E]CAE6443601.1 unnamed protein product [Rhizoctonia solani]
MVQRSEGPPSAPEFHYGPPLPGRTSNIPPPTRPKLHRYVAIASYVSVGVISVYNIFYADYGKEEHVFSPARRWLDQQKTAFWTLSPAEQAAADRLKRQEVPRDTDRPT